MKADYINPFIMSTYEVFESMMDCEVKAGDIQINSDEKDSLDLVGIIGLSGTAQGAVALRFPVKTALSIVGAMIGDKIRSVDSSVIDGVGELVNIIAGKAKANMKGHSLSISLPTVVRGTIIKNTGLNKSEWYEIPFTGSLGDFYLAVTFKTSTEKNNEEIHESTNC